MKKIGLKILLFIFLAQLMVGPCLATNLDQNFKAVVLDILEQRQIDDGDGVIINQQRLQLLGLDGDWQGKELIYDGIGELVVLNSIIYQTGDKVLVNQTINDNNEEIFYVVDHVRTAGLWWLGLLFVLVVLVIGRQKGFRSLVALALTFVVIIKLFIPIVIAGQSPIIWGLVSVAIILPIMIVVTDGWSRKSLIAVISILICLILTMIISVLFSNLMHLSGMGGEETLLLMGNGKTIIDFRGLFFISILIGALGVLDDVVLGQIEAVVQIKIANNKLSNNQVFKMAGSVGKSHLGAMINTLFLAYAGAALPLLLLLSLKQPPFVSMFYAINSEIIAVEIVRALVGGVGLALAIPISTYLAVRFINRKKLA
jgi:uncharacterized membrane protein